MKKYRGADFFNLLNGDWFEFIIEVGSIMIGFAILCIFPIGIFERWPDLAVLIGAVIIIAVIAIVWLIIHLIKRNRS